MGIEETFAIHQFMLGTANELVHNEDDDINHREIVWSAQNISHRNSGEGEYGSPVKPLGEINDKGSHLEEEKEFETPEEASARTGIDVKFKLRPPIQKIVKHEKFWNFITSCSFYFMQLRK